MQLARRRRGRVCCKQTMRGKGVGRGEKREPIALPLEARENVFDSSSLFHREKERERRCGGEVLST